MANPAKFHNRNQNIIASFLILKKGNKILLSKRLNTGYHDGDYGLISGHVEKGETFTQAMIREAYEEANVILNKKDLSVGHVMHRKSDFDGSERVDVYFIASNWRGDLKNQEPGKCGGLVWFETDNLPENMVPCVRCAIQNMGLGLGYSELGW